MVSRNLLSLLLAAAASAHVCDKAINTSCTAGTRCLQSLLDEAALHKGAVTLPCGSVPTDVLHLGSGVRLSGATNGVDCAQTVLSACNAVGGQKTLVEMAPGKAQTVRHITFDMANVNTTEPINDNMVALVCRSGCWDFLIHRNQFVNLPCQHAGLPGIKSTRTHCSSGPAQARGQPITSTRVVGTV